MPERFRRGLNGLLVLLILGALAYASALLFGWNCPIKYLTGVPCPGCGLSRALAALLLSLIHISMTWVASGHVGGFSDPLMDCKECKERFRADKVIEDWCAENNYDLGKSVDALSQAEMKAFIDEHEIACPTCGKHNWTAVSYTHLFAGSCRNLQRGGRDCIK